MHFVYILLSDLFPGYAFALYAVAVDSANRARTCRGGWSLVAEGRWSLYTRYFTLRTIRPKESGRNRQVVAI